MSKFIAGLLLAFSASTYTYTRYDIEAIGNVFYAEGVIQEKARINKSFPEIFSGVCSSQLVEKE